jgi:molybdopterin-guanine dinucleotide biosynthesis protein A
VSTIPLARRVAGALRDAGCPDITCVGGDLDGLRALGLAAAPDDHPGEGPLGGILTGLRLASLHLVVVLACDLPAIDGATIRGLLRSLDTEPGADVAVPVVEDRLQVHVAAFRRSARPALLEAFERGERSVTRAIDGLTVVTVDRLDPGALIDVDSPSDLDQ